MLRVLKIFIGLISLISCEKIFFESSKSSTDYIVNFEYLWKVCDERYAFFEEKNIDWDKVYDEYLPRVKSSKNDLEFFRVISSMLSELRDGHVNIVSPFDVFYYNFKNTYLDNFEWSIVRKNYLGNNYHSTGPFIHKLIYSNLYRREKVNIGYIRLSKFTGKVSNYILDFVLNRYRNTPGLILDLRENPGGSSSDVTTILKRFISKPTTIYYVQNKKGKSRQDFTAIEPVTLEPHKGISYTKSKVMVLVDRGTFSAGSFFALSTKAIDNVHLVGDYTGGGLGLPSGGQLPNGWLYRISVSKTLDKDGNNYETTGVPPDIKTQLKHDEMKIDEIIERAIDEILIGIN